MRILLIGNFAPPFEEENLHNISLLNRLENDGHKCTVLNVSENSSTERRYIDSKSVPDFVLKLFQYCRDKDVVHFSTKGYLRVGLLKLMASIFVGKLFRIKTVLTFHSELFSVLGQMRSPFGGTQTLNTSFFLVDKIIYHDKDTYEVASMYRKKSNFELIPSFIHVPEGMSSDSDKLMNCDNVIVFSNIIKPSFSFEILMELLSGNTVPSNTGIVISLTGKNTEEIRHSIVESSNELTDNIIFIGQNDIKSTLLAYSKAAVIIRPLSCDGETFFEGFSLSVKKPLHLKDTIYFPGGMVLIKEGKTAGICVDIINTIVSSEDIAIPELNIGDPYTRIKQIYEN